MGAAGASAASARAPEQIKRDGWQVQRVLVVDADDERLTWPERELVRQLGEKLYGEDAAAGGSP